MAELLLGLPVTKSICEKASALVATAKEKGITPSLAIVRVGEKPDDIYYERSAVKRCDDVGISTKLVTLSADIAQNELALEIEKLNGDSTVSGVLLLRPLPKHIDEDAVCNLLSPKKDIDGITDASLCGVFTGKKTGYPPCTARACMEVLDFYGIELSGKKSTVVGRSLVVGRPVAMMLMQKNSTVTICHTRTEDTEKHCREADIIIASAGRASVIGKENLRDGQIIVDVGINPTEDGGICGDVSSEAAESYDLRYTPVPRGVGTVTTAVLALHVAEAATE